MSVDILNQEHFSAFLDQSVRLLIAPDAVGVFDNARIHHTLASRLMLEDVFDNNYYFLPVYSPHLNPIEPYFALVKEWIRNNEEESLADPVHYINMAFNQFSVCGLRAGSVLGHFNLYIANHEAYLSNLDED